MPRRKKSDVEAITLPVGTSPETTTAKPKRLSKSEKAVAVASDVIAQLRKRNSKLIPVLDNGYVSSSFLINLDDPRVKKTRNNNYENEVFHVELQDILPDMMKEECRVCGLGAAIISKARLLDKVQIEGYGFEINPGYELHRDKISEGLKDVFTEDTIDKIECAFEVDPYMADTEEYAAALFGAKHKEPKKRLIAIMQNIVDNGGKFLVAKATEADWYGYSN